MQAVLVDPTADTQSRRLKNVSTDDLNAEMVSTANEMLLDVQATLDLVSDANQANSRD